MIDRFKSNRRIVHPGYNPEEGLWFTEEDVTAKSLHELQAKLPGVLIEGYYPGGYTPERPKPQQRLPQEMTRPVTRNVLDAGSWYRQPKAAVAPVVPLAVLERSAQLSFELEKEPVPDQGVVEFKPIRMKRKYSRVLPRARPSDVTQRAFQKVNWADWDDRLVTMLKSGLPVITIAERINCSRNAVIGRAHRLKLSISQERGTAKRKLLPRLS